MAIDKNVQQLTQVTSLLNTDLHYIPRPSTGEDCFITHSDLLGALGIFSPVSITCIASSTTQINLGNITVFNACSIDMFFVRGENRARKQIIEVFQINGEPQILEGAYSTKPNTVSETTGITMSVALATGDILLNIIVDNSDTNNVILDYVFLNKR